MFQYVKNAKQEQDYKDVEAPKKRDISMILSSVVFNDYCSVIDVLILVTLINQCYGRVDKPFTSKSVKQIETKILFIHHKMRA